jgi:hypothetical protein
MQFSYMLLDQSGKKVDEFIKLSARVANGWILPHGYMLLVGDNITPARAPFLLLSQNAIEDFLAEQEIIQSRRMEQIYDGPLESAGGIVSPPEGKPQAKWNPFADTEVVMKLVDSNLKTAAAVGKPKTSGVPPIAIMALGAAMQNGVDKYGKFNWRGTGVTASVFYDAMMRHLNEWYAGEDHASDSNVHHLAHLMAGGAILLDAMQHNVLNDDRNNGERTVNPKSQTEVYLSKGSHE